MGTAVRFSEMASELSQEQQEAYRETFVLFDRDGGGSIDAKELGTVMRSLGQNPTDDELNDMIQEVDVDGNGEIDFDEFCAMMVKMMKTHDSLYDIKLAFDVFDVDGDGHITREELKESLCRHGQKLTDEEFDELFNETDVD